MDMPNELNLGDEMRGLIHTFENLNGAEQLEFIKVVLEKMENGEIEINDKIVYPQNIGIPDGYKCLLRISEIIEDL